MTTTTIPASSTLRLLVLGAVAVGAVASDGATKAAIVIDPKLPAYESVSGISGTMRSIGSDTLNNLMTMWAEDFVGLYPNVKPEIEGKGSATAFPALIEGRAHFGPSSREASKAEEDRFESVFKYKLTKVAVAIDGLAVFVHKDNPLTSLTMAQVDGIFSSTFKAGGKSVTTWDQVGLSAWSGKAITAYGRNSASGTYGFFKEIALKKGDFKPTINEQAGSSGVVGAVAGDQLGIGYSGIGYLTAGVKPLALAAGKGAPVSPTYENCVSGDYPLARFLYVYINKAPGKPLEPMVLEFLKFVLSRDGQNDVQKDGYFPLTAAMAAEERKKLE